MYAYKKLRLKKDTTNIENLELGLHLYSVNRVAELLGIGRDTLLTLIANGEIKTVKVLNRHKISLQELLRFNNKDTRAIPYLDNEIVVPIKENKRVTKIDNSTIDKIFNKVKNKVMENEKAKEKNIS
jgi:excisionase family DNA binding protein